MSSAFSRADFYRKTSLAFFHFKRQKKCFFNFNRLAEQNLRSHFDWISFFFLPFIFEMIFIKCAVKYRRKAKRATITTKRMGKNIFIV